ncbi:phosphoglycerate mutase-like protein [Pycnococcus provasolii]
MCSINLSWVRHVIAPAASSTSSSPTSQQQQEEEPEILGEASPLILPEDLPQSKIVPQQLIRSFYTRYPRRIILVRHGESLGNVQPSAYTVVPDHAIPLTREGYAQATRAGEYIAEQIEKDGPSAHAHIYMSPYRRSVQTAEGIANVFPKAKVRRQQQDVQLREQDFGNFQDLDRSQRDMRERLRFGRFYYRFQNGESGADVYDRITGFQDHLVRDITAGRFSGSTTLVLVTHGLALRVFLMRWFHLTVEEFLQVYNPNNAKPIILERDVENALCNLEQKTGKFEKEDMPSHWFDADATAPWRHTKSLYRIRQESIEQLSGLTSDMCGGCCGETCEIFDDQSTKPQPFD